MKEEESSKEEVTAAVPAKKWEVVPAELDRVCTPEPLHNNPKCEDQEIACQKPAHPTSEWWRLQTF